MNYLENKSIGFYISSLGAAAALISLFLYRSVSRAETSIVILLAAIVVLQAAGAILLAFVKNCSFTSLLIPINAVLAAAALTNSFFTQVDAIGYVVSGLYDFSTIQPFITAVIPMAVTLILYITASYSGLEKDAM